MTAQKGRNKKNQGKLDPNATDDPNQHLSGELETWDTAVIKAASHFTVCKMQGPSRNERRTVVYRTFLESHKHAKDDPKALIYAITAEGRSCCVPRKVYRDACIMWHETYPTGIDPHVFNPDQDQNWFSYGHGFTTGPWPTDMQAILVGTLLNSLQIWDRCTPLERHALRRAVEALNVKLREQGREPWGLPQ